jgi:hypothetical protein
LSFSACYIFATTNEEEGIPKEKKDKGEDWREPLLFLQNFAVRGNLTIFFSTPQAAKRSEETEPLL